MNHTDALLPEEQFDILFDRFKIHMNHLIEVDPDRAASIVTLIEEAFSPAPPTWSEAAVLRVRAILEETPPLVPDGYGPIQVPPLPDATPGAHHAWNAGQQHGGGPAAPDDSFHAPAVGGVVDTSADASTSAVPEADDSAASPVQEGRHCESAGTSDVGDVERPKPKEASDEGPPYSCGFKGCSHVAKRKWNLKQHLKQKHLRERKFRCLAKGCGAKLGRKYDLKRHILFSHRYKGSLCDLMGQDTEDEADY